MLYALICIDKPDAAEIRKANREAHFEHLKTAGDSIAAAGPFLDDEGAMCGSLILYEAQERATVERWAMNDPYAKAGLFESVSVRPWKKVIG